MHIFDEHRVCKDQLGDVLTLLYKYRNRDMIPLEATSLKGGFLLFTFTHKEGRMAQWKLRSTFTHKMVQCGVRFTDIVSCLDEHGKDGWEPVQYTETAEGVLSILLKRSEVDIIVIPQEGD